MLTLLLRSIVFAGLVALLARLYTLKRPRGPVAEALDSAVRGTAQLLALFSTQGSPGESKLSAMGVVGVVSAAMVGGVLLGLAAAQSVGLVTVLCLLLLLVGGLVAVDVLTGEEGPARANAGAAEGRDYEEVVRLRNRTRKSEAKHFDVCDHIVGQWSLRREVAVECNSLIELVLRDFIHPWYDWMSDDTDFIRDIQESVADSLGMLLSQLKERVHPIMFVFDTICDAVTRQFQVYRTVVVSLKRDATMRQIIRNSYQGKVSLADWNLLQTRIAEEFRKRGRLHPMLIWDGSETDGADQSSTSQLGDRPVMADHLSMEEFQDPERVKLCERSYLRFISSRIIRKLLVNKENLNSKPIRHLVREIFANTILLPVASLFIPSTINWWIDMGLAQMTTADVLLAEDEEQAQEDAAERTGRHFDTIVPVGKAPRGFDPADPAWKNSAGSIGPEEAACLLAGEPAGSYLIRKSQEDDAPTAFVLSVVAVVAGDDTSPVNRATESFANFTFDEGRPSMMFPSGGELEVRHFRISCSPSSFSVVDKEAIFACIKQPGLIYTAVTNPSTSLSSLCSGLRPVLLKGLDVVQLAVDGGGVVNPDLIPTVPIVREKTQDTEITNAEPDSAVADADVDADAPALTFDINADQPIEAPLSSLDTGLMADSDMPPSKDSDTQGALTVSPSEPSPMLDLEFLAEQHRNVLLLELNAAMDELNDFITFTRQHMGVVIPAEDEFAVLPPIPIGDAPGVESVARALQAVDNILRHGMIVTRSATHSKDAAGARLNSFNRSTDGQTTHHTRKHSEAEGTAQLLFNPSQAGVISDYFQDAGGDAVVNTNSVHNSRDSGSSIGHENDFEADRKYTSVILANLIHTCHAQLGDLETPDADVIQAAWLWLVQNRRVVFDFGEGARLLDIDSSKTKSLADMSRITGGCINMLVWLSLGRLAEGIRLLTRNDATLQEIYDECALMRVRGDRRKMLDALEIVGGQLFTMQGYGGPAREKRNFLGRAVSRVFSATKKPESGESSPVCEPKRLTRRPSWRGTLSGRSDSRVLDSHDERIASRADTSADEPRGGLTNVLSKPMNALKNNFKARDDVDRPPLLERQSSQAMKAVLESIVNAPASVLENFQSDMIPRHLYFHENASFVENHRRRRATAAARWAEKRGEGWRKDQHSPAVGAQHLLSAQLEGFVRSVTGESITLDTHDAANAAPAPDLLESAGNGKPHSFKLRESFARAAWILSSMLKERDDISSLKRKGIWADPSMRLPMTPRITFAQTESHKQGPAKSTVTLYCTAVSTASATQAGQEWAVARRYNDFDALHRHLRLQVGSSVILPTLPPKNRLGFGSTDAAFIENRRICLEKYLHELLNIRALANCFELWVFLRPDVTSAVAAMMDPLNVGTVAAQGPRDKELLSEAYMHTLIAKQDAQLENEDADASFVFTVRNLDDTSENELYATGAHASEFAMLEKSDELKMLGRPEDYDDIPASQVKLVDADMMRRIENRVYCLLREVLEMDRMNIVRRQVLVLLRRTLRMFFTSSMAEWISSKYQVYQRDTYITMLVQFIRDAVWPNGVLILPGVSPSDEEDHATRHKLQQSLNKLIPSTLDSLIGREQSEKGMTSMYHMLQNWVLLKSLFFIILDLVLIELLPDLAEVLDGADCLR